jgi:hypothetical protein
VQSTATRLRGLTLQRRPCFHEHRPVAAVDAK